MPSAGSHHPWLPPPTRGGVRAPRHGQGEMPCGRQCPGAALQAPMGPHTRTHTFKGTGPRLRSKGLKESSRAQPFLSCAVRLVLPIPPWEPPAHLCASPANSARQGASNSTGLIYLPCSCSSPAAQAHNVFKSAAARRHLQRHIPCSERAPATLPSKTRGSKKH